VLADLDDTIRRAREAVREEGARQRVEMAARGLEYTHLVVDYLQTVATVRGQMAHDRWMGAVTPELKQEAREVAGPKAETIRQFIEAHQASGAIGGMNGYIEHMLKPELIVAAWRESWREPEGVVLTKAQWLQDHAQEMSPDLPAEFDLWVYGNDLDFVNGKPEHTLIATGADGREVVVGHVGTRDRPGDGTSRAYIIRGVRRDWLDQGVLRLIVTNEAGGPFLSRFFAFYLMPAVAESDPDAAGARIETDIEWARRRALGFVEYGFDGLLSHDGDRDDVAIELAGAPAL
jgi:hypothetical protein